MSLEVANTGTLRSTVPVGPIAVRSLPRAGSRGVGLITVATLVSRTGGAWARDPTNPVGGYYGLRKGYCGRFANYVTPVLELRGRVELEHAPKNNRVRASRGRGMTKSG